MKNIHLIPTSQPSNLLLCIKNYIVHKDTPAEDSDVKGNFRIGYGKYANKEFYLFQNIYITNDEKPKAGDWGFNIKINTVIHFSTIYGVNEYCKKIILTTDQSLRGVQAIDDDFLEWFVKNPSCEYIKVNEEQLNNKPGSSYSTLTKYKYKIIIPQEEPKQECGYCKQPISKYGCACGKQIEEPKQETLEKAANHYVKGFEYN